MYVFLLFSSPCPIFQLHMMCPGLAMATVQGEHPSIFSFLSVPLSKTHAPLSVGLFFWVIWPFLCPTFCWIIWAYLAVGADFALGTLTDSSPAFSRPVFSPGRPTTTSCLYEAGMQKDLWQQHNKNLSGVENVEATFEFHLFCKSPACAFYTVHCTGKPFSAWQKGKCKRVNRGGGSI